MSFPSVFWLLWYILTFFKKVNRFFLFPTIQFASGFWKVISTYAKSHPTKVVDVIHAKLYFDNHDFHISQLFRMLEKLFAHPQSLLSFRYEGKYIRGFLKQTLIETFIIVTDIGSNQLLYNFVILWSKTRRVISSVLCQKLNFKILIKWNQTGEMLNFSLYKALSCDGFFFLFAKMHMFIHTYVFTFSLSYLFHF